MSLTYHGYTALNIEPQKLFGRPGLGLYRLGFSVKLRAPGNKAASPQPGMHPASAVSDIAAEIYARGGSAPDHYLGTARPEFPQTIALRESDYESQVIFDLELDRARIEALEELRAGGDLWFRPRWYCVAHGPQGPQVLESSGVELHANLSTWLSVLKDMAYRASLLFEIPIPNDERGGLREAVRLLNAAEEDYRANRSGDAITDCRKALEELAAIFDSAELEKAKQLFAKSTRDDNRPNRLDMTVQQRFLMVYETLRNVTHLSAHARLPGTGYDYARRDAAAVIALTAVLLSRTQSA